MTAQLDLIASLPDTTPAPQPDLWIIIARYEGPGWAHGNWKVYGPCLSPAEAEKTADSLNKWMKRRQIFKT